MRERTPNPTKKTARSASGPLRLDSQDEPHSADTFTRPTLQTSARFGVAAAAARLVRAISALEAHGMRVIRAANASEARRIVLELLPEGAQVYQGASQTLEVTGITQEIETSGRHVPVRPRLRSMDRQRQGDEIRRLAAAPDVMLGSVHAVTETGSLLAASNTGSQLGAYAIGAGRVIFVVGTQKVVADIEEGIQRIEEYCLPREDARSLAAYGTHSGVSKVLIIHRELVPGRITVVLVDEVLGF